MSQWFVICDTTTYIGDLISKCAWHVLKFFFEESSPKHNFVISHNYTIRRWRRDCRRCEWLWKRTRTRIVYYEIVRFSRRASHQNYSRYGGDIDHNRRSHYITGTRITLRSKLTALPGGGRENSRERTTFHEISRQRESTICGFQSDSIVIRLFGIVVLCADHSWHCSFVRVVWCRGYSVARGKKEAIKTN